MKSKTVKLGVRHRSMTIARDVVDADGRAEFSASSESPVLSYDWEIGRYFEVLDHSPAAVRMGRLQDGAPLLKDHDRGIQIGVVESARVEGGQLRVGARFGNSEVAKAERADVADGIRSKVSIGYIVHELVLAEKRENGVDVYRATDWEPLEVSTVAIPADPTVGFGRAEGDVAFRDHETRVIRRDIRQGETMEKIWVVGEDGVLRRINASEFDATKHERAAAPAVMQAAPAPQPSGVSVGATRGAEAVDTAAVAQAERQRVQEILAIGARFNCTDKANDAIRDGLAWERFRDHVWMSQPAGTPLDKPKSALGMSPKEVKRFSILRAVSALVDHHKREDAAFELECSRAVAEQTGQTPRGFFVPADVLYDESDFLLGTGGRSRNEGRRDLLVGTPTAGGNLVATNLLAGSFIELLRNRAAVMRLGARTLPGLVGNVDIPRQSGGATAGFVAEATNVPESEATFDKVSLVPRTLGVWTDISRKLLLQATPAIEGLVRDDLNLAIALGVDNVAINGSGTAPTPRGIRNVVGIGSVALGTNGAAPTWVSQVNLVASVMVANADIGALGFLTNAKAWATLMGAERTAANGRYLLEEPGTRLLGYGFDVSNQVPSNLVKGSSGAVCSAEIFGNWAELFIGEWGTLDLFPDPYTLGDQGAIRIRAFKDLDIAVRHPASFAVISDMLTTI